MKNRSKDDWILDYNILFYVLEQRFVKQKITYDETNNETTKIKKKKEKKNSDNENKE